MTWQKKTHASDAPARDPMQEFANTVIEHLELGVKPWVRPWDPLKCGGPQAPMNPVTKRRYRGCNVLILGMDMRAFQTGDPRWVTFMQAKEKGWNVRKGEKATAIFFTKQLGGNVPDHVEGEVSDEPGKQFIFFMKSYAVFHASQVEGILPFTPPTIEQAPWRRPEAADIIIRNSGAVVRTGGDRAFYSPSTDHIQLPPDHAFRGPPEFAATALHELFHWSGHNTRLNREEAMKAKYGSAAYAMEELRAELGSAFMAAELGIPSEISGHASYIASWVQKLKDDKRTIFQAAADAQRGVDMLLGFHPAFASQPQRPEQTPDGISVQPVPA